MIFHIISPWKIKHRFQFFVPGHTPVSPTEPLSPSSYSLVEHSMPLQVSDQWISMLLCFTYALTTALLVAFLPDNQSHCSSAAPLLRLPLHGVRLCPSCRNHPHALDLSASCVWIPGGFSLWMVLLWIQQDNREYCNSYGIWIPNNARTQQRSTAV